MTTAAAMPPPPPAPTRDQEDREYAACLMHPAWMIDRFGMIDNVQDDGLEAVSGARRAVPFRLWAAQANVLDVLLARREVIILKARQLGISWVVCGFVLWLCVSHAGRVVMLFSKGQDEANELVRRIRALYGRLPDWLRARLPALEVDNVRELGWGNGSTVQAKASTASAGVSYTASLIVLDEAARMVFGDKLYVAAKPTIDQGGQIILLSTAFGLGGFFHKIWKNAVAGRNSFEAVFIPWWHRPGRTPAWYRKIVRDADDPGLVPQEYPANPTEAFVGSGRLRFPNEWVAAQDRYHAADPIPRSAWPHAMFARPDWPGVEAYTFPDVTELAARGLKVFAPPRPGRAYVVAGDVAEGKDPDGQKNSDHNTLVVVDRATGEEMASMEFRAEPDVLAANGMLLSEVYNGAVLVVERNNHGHAALLEVKHRKFPARRVGLGPDGYPGWPTTPVTKPLGVDLLAKALRTNAIAVRNRAAIAQIAGYSVLKNGSTGAPVGEHDDYVSAWVVALSYLDSGAPSNTATQGYSPIGGYRG